MTYFNALKQILEQRMLTRIVSTYLCVHFQVNQKSIHSCRNPVVRQTSIVGVFLSKICQEVG